MQELTELATITGTGDFRRIEVRKVLNGEPTTVWEAITRSGEIGNWWSTIEIDAREGGRVICVDDVNNSREGDIPPLDGNVTAFRPPHVFEFTWNEATKPAKGLVRFDLVEVDGATCLTLIYFVMKADVQIVAAGWHLLVERLAEYLDTGQVVKEDNEREQELQSRYKDLLR